MDILLYIAAFLAVGMGLVHSLLGEKYIITPLLRQDNLPVLFGSTDFTIRTIRFAWHITTLAWWGLASILILMAHPPLETETVGMVVGITFLAHFLTALIGSKGKHMSWLAFLIIGIIALYAAKV
ncbi:MAG: hypothetical protein ACI845_000323 [Gammaproteobacteria bacterium]|jgi:hypothetical protein